MNQNLLYKIDKAVKQKVNPSEIKIICRQYLTKFPNNIRVLNILNSLNLESDGEKLEQSKTLLKLYLKSNELQKSYDLAIKLINYNKKDPYLYSTLGDILKKSNNFLEAMHYYKKSLETDHNYERVNSKLYEFLMTTNPSEFISEWSEGFGLLLSNKKNLGHAKLNLIATKALKYFKLNPTFKDLSKYVEIDFLDLNPLKFRSEKEVNHIKKNIEILSVSKVFISCIEETIIYDIQIEKFLTFLRKFILLNIEDLQFIQKVSNIIGSLALNCFFNDYIFNVSKEENIKLKELENKSYLNKKPDFQFSKNEFLCLAMYKNLSNFNFNNRIKFNELPSKFLEFCILNPLREKKIIKGIKMFSKISDDISTKVKEQYETFPYPSWVYTDTYLEKTNLSEYINSLGLNFSNNHFFSKNYKSLLIAGCGTGKEAIEYNELILDLEITAIDLSIKSLGYAIRKHEDTKFKNINFLQGDILNLEKINKKFDLIFSNGVIHHMKNPTLGCKALLTCLNTNGIMKLSLYSKIARRNVLKFQDIAKLQNINSHQLLRDFRNTIIKDNNVEAQCIKKIGDFYNSSTFKDLICHEQEHTFTIQKIKILLETLNLEFCGFQNSNNLHKNFIEHFNSSHNLYNLDYWEEFEEIYPDTFYSMYQIWLKKL